MSDRVYARRIKRKLKPVENRAPSDNDVRLDQSKPIQYYPTLAEKVAKSTIYVKNWYMPEMRVDRAYRYDDRMKRIDKFFPYAQGGPLLVDEPSDVAEAEKCYAKAIKAKEWGYRYIVIESDTDFFGCLKQLGEV